MVGAARKETAGDWQHRSTIGDLVGCLARYKAGSPRIAKRPKPYWRRLRSYWMLEMRPGRNR